MASTSIQQLPLETSPNVDDLLLLEDTTVTVRASDGGVLLASPTTLTSASGLFTLADDGRIVVVVGAGDSGADLVSVCTYVSPNELTLTTAATTEVSGADVYFPITKAVKVGSLPPVVSYTQGSDSSAWGPFANPYNRPVNIYVEDILGNPQICLPVFNVDYSTIEIHGEPAFSGTVWLLP